MEILILRRFKSPPVPFPQPSFDYAFCPQPSVPQKRSFKQTMDTVHRDNTTEIHRNTYQISEKNSLSQSQKFHVSTPELFGENGTPQQITRQQNSQSKSNILPNKDLCQDNTHEGQKKLPNEYQKNHKNSGELHSIDAQKHGSPPSAFAGTSAPVDHKSKFSDGSSYKVSEGIPNLYPPSPKVVIESLPPKYTKQSHLEYPRKHSASSQNLRNRLPSPKVVINNEMFPVIEIHHKKIEDHNITNITKRHNLRIASPEVVIEMPSRDVLAEYRSPDELRSSSQQYFQRPSQEFRKQRDKDDERSEEAEDSIISDPSSNSYLSILVPSSINSNEPLLTSMAIRQLTKYVGKVSRYKLLEDVEVDDLGRILKILERSVREVETSDILPNNYSSSSHEKKRSSVNLENDLTENDEMDVDVESNITIIDDKLEKIINGVEAAIAAFSIMTGGKLSKQLYPEDLITSSLNLVKGQLGGIIYRIFEMNTSDDALNSRQHDQFTVTDTPIPLPNNLFISIAIDIFFVASLPESSVKSLEELSDAIVITISFIAIGPFFVDSASGNSNFIFGNGLEAVKLVALDLLRSVFINHPKQRTWILEEILTSLIKLPTVKRNLRQYRLPDGKSIQMVSALILQLIQSCTAGISQIDLKSADECREMEITEKVVHNEMSESKKIGYINDKKADTYTKSMAIDYLGTIAGRIKKFSNSGIKSYEETSDEIWEEKDERRWFSKIKNIPKGEITTLTRTQAIKNLYECQKAVLSFLEISATEDPAVQCARQFYLTEWGFSFVNTLQLMGEKRLEPKCNEEEEKIKYNSMKKLMDKIIVEYWKMSSEDHITQSLGQRSQSVDRSDILLITELLASRQSLYQNFDSILSRILVSLDTGVVAFRTKALRALGQVVVCDPSILSQVNVRQTIAQRLSDNSPAVRDAAIDLVGRYLSQKPEITEQYYKVISDRVLDTGLNVRKRVIKLLRDIFLKSTDQAMMIDIGCKILMRINDDDDHVKELALKTIQELWFTPFKHQKNVSNYLDEDERQSEFNMMSAVGKKEVLARSLLIVGVSERLGERNGHIIGAFFKKVLEKDDKQKREILSICQCMVDCLFEHLLTLQDSNSKTEVVSCISTICLLSNASPTLVSNHVVTLQPYLKSASTSDDQSILYYVLMIYRNVLPLLKRPNPIFLNEIETALMGLLTKSPQKILQEVVPCLCVIIDKLTFNYARLIKLLRSCTEKLKVEKKQLEAGKELSSARNVMVLLLIIGLLCKNFDFDKKRADQPEKMKDLDSIDKGPIITIIFQLALFFCKENLSEAVQKMALQSLGFIYLSYPIIMLRLESTDLMDRILQTGAMDMRIQLMKVFLDFLVAEQQKINADLEDKKPNAFVTNDIVDVNDTMETWGSSSSMQIEERLTDTKEIQNGTLTEGTRNIENENVLPLSYAAKVSICMTILMHLKDHLKKLYSLSEVKCQNFNPTQSGSHKDKPAIRNQTAPFIISWEGFPFLDKPLALGDLWLKMEREKNFLKMSLKVNRPTNNQTILLTWISI
ncbi:3073_t:CDS:10 [Acaulospora morrowiae]|uniref:3073_t:CDS:1 n=1 Tax=Acaulospora morrowiae TaxID=94023 RepID=A0A9N8ZC15_9GLOM|nr:3073_t:CDS:10 [Acaulospora morrowiae]